MKKLLYSIILSSLLMSFGKNANAQIDTLFYESFDSIPAKWEMTNSSTPSNRPVPWFWENQITMNNSPGAAADTIGIANTSSLTTPMIFVDTFTSVNLSFSQICYVEALDDALVEYRFGNSTWAPLPAASYKGLSTYVNGIPGTPNYPELKFSKNSQALLWKAQDTSFIWSQASAASAWVREDFDLSDLVTNRPVGSGDSMQIRLRYVDEASSIQGRVGEHIWYVDEFNIIGGNCDLVPPIISLIDPPINYPNRYEDRVYLNGPWIFEATVTDNRGQVDTVYIPYVVMRENIVTGVYDTLLIDTIPMDRFVGGNFRGRIESSLPNGDAVQFGDSIYWKVEARDGSICKNLAQDPPAAYTRFLVKPTLPPSCRDQSILYQFPYVEDFEGPVFNLPSQNVLGAGWSNITGDFHNWWSTSQPSSPSGAFRILTDYPGGGKYLYVESDNPNGGSYKDSSAFLLSPCFDFTELPNGLVRFYANTNTAGIDDSIRVDIFDPTPVPGFPEGQFVTNVIPSIKGNKGDNWLPYEFSTFPYRNYITQIRWVGIPGRDDGLGDMAIDSFKVVPAALIDMRINSVILEPFIPSQGTAGQEEVTINVQNLGVAPITTFTMNYEVIGGPTVQSFGPATWNGSIAPGENINIDFPATGYAYNVPLGRFSIRAWIDYAGDAIPGNDTTANNSRGLFYKDGSKYMDNFDKDTLWTVFVEDDSLFNKWELGTPNYDYTYSAYTGRNSWDMLLDRGYSGTGKTSTLLSPFLDFSTVDDAIISFINNRDITKTRDGVFIEYSFDRGLHWDSLTSTHDLGRWRWYNSTLSSGGFGGSPVFAGTTYCWGNTWNGYLESELQFPPLFNFEEEVLLRFQFFAEAGGRGNDGMSIDNVLVYDPEPLDLQVQHFVSPTSQCDLLQNQRIRTVIKNRGLNPVSNFEMEYTVTSPDGSVEVKTDQINRVFNHRDTIHVTSLSTFDMFGLGDYDIQVKAKLAGDQCTINDTLLRKIENVEGCSLLFRIETSGRTNTQLPCDSSVWKFNYSSSNGRSYQISHAYNSPIYPINIGGFGLRDTVDIPICMRGDSDVEFRLDDKDDLIDRYSMIAYNGENDTILYRDVNGGGDSRVQRFNWICPPERSTTPIEIRIDDNLIQLPVPKDYFIDVIVLNNGLDSLDSVRVYFQIDQGQIEERVKRFNLGEDLKYNRAFKQPFGLQNLTAGAHILRAWTTLPNGQQDLRVSDDTLEVPFTVMSTIPPNEFASNERYCATFDDNTEVPWIAANPYTLSQLNNAFEQGTPSSTNINGAFSGNGAWATRLDTTYQNQEEAMLLSPFFPVIQDSCYKVSFRHKYHILDSLHDGGTVRLLNSNNINVYSDNVWDQIGNVLVFDSILNRLDTINPLGDTIFAEQNGWYKTRHILSIPDNTKNAGWSGITNDWVIAESVLRPTKSYDAALMWRFESDGSNVSDGWAIDDFCIEQLPLPSCYPVSIGDNQLDASKVYLGQNIPNPATNQTVIPIYLPKAAQMRFEVINLLGQPVHQQSQNHPRGDGLIELNTSSFAGGIYYYTLTIDGKRFTEKMIITK